MLKLSESLQSFVDENDIKINRVLRRRDLKTQRKRSHYILRVQWMHYLQRMTLMQ